MESHYPQQAAWMPLRRSLRRARGRLDASYGAGYQYHAVLQGYKIVGENFAGESDHEDWKAAAIPGITKYEVITVASRTNSSQETGVLNLDYRSRINGFWQVKIDLPWRGLYRGFG